MSRVRFDFLRFRPAKLTQPWWNEQAKIAKHKKNEYVGMKSRVGLIVCVQETIDPKLPIFNLCSMKTIDISVSGVRDA